MDSEYSQTLIGGKAGLPALLDAIEAHLADHGAPPAAVGPVLIASDEIVSNILNHGGDGRSDPVVEVSLRVGAGRVAVQIVDDGAAFNPIEAAPPDTGLPVEDRAIGGLGIHLVRELMDDVAYERRAGRNQLRFSKAFSTTSAFRHPGDTTS